MTYRIPIFLWSVVVIQSYSAAPIGGGGRRQSVVVAIGGSLLDRQGAGHVGVDRAEKGRCPAASGPTG